MKIKGLSLEQIEQCAREAGAFKLCNMRSIGNYHFFVLRMASHTPRHCGNGSPHKNGLMCTRPNGHEGKHWHRDDQRKIHDSWFAGDDNPAMRYRKRGIMNMMYSHGPRYGVAVCFHGFKEFMDRVFDLNPQAIIRTAACAYLGKEDFETKWPGVGRKNVGSQMCPVSYAECCDC